MAIFRQLFSDRKGVLTVIVIVCILVVQAYCDLSLPKYTANIVDVGIMQGGIEDAVPDMIRASSLEELALFMPDDKIEYVERYYKKASGDEASAFGVGDAESDADGSAEGSAEGDAQSSAEGNAESGADNGTLMRLSVDRADKANAAVIAALDKIFEVPMLIVGAGKGITEASDMQALAGSAGGEAPAGSAGSETPTGSAGSETLADSVAQSAPQSETDADSASGEARPTAIDIEKLAAGYRAGAVTKEQLLDMRGEAEKMIESLGDLVSGAASVAYVKAEYEAIGVDLGKVQTDYMKRVALMMILLTLGSILAAIVVCFLASFRAAGVGRRLRRDMFFNILSFSGREMDKFSSASLITRSTNDIQQIQLALVLFMRLMLLAPVMGIGGVIMVRATHTGMDWIVAVAVGILLGIVIFLMNFTMPKFKLMQSLIDRVNLVSRETLTGLPVIRAFCKETYEIERFEQANKDLTSTQLFTSRAMSLMFPLLMFVMNIVSVMIIWFGGHEINEGNILVGDMMAFINYTMMIVMSFMMISIMAVMLPRANVAAERLEEVLAVKASITDKPEKELVHKEDWSGRVAFENMSFRFPDADADVLAGIEFTAEPGQTTAIIGSTGSGKSTLVNLIPRLFDVTGGRITIDGVDIRDISLHELRGIIGVVPQKGFLFSGDIASNIRYGRPGATDEEVAMSAGIAQADSFIAEKEGGYASEIAQGGDNVSGGQKQRLAIARAVAKDPRIFIFDDSFSALDYKTDTELRHALARELSGRTILIVAQRIATILRADKIVVLDEGHIAGIGTHKELLADCEVYREIAASQLSEEELAS
ncbi:MAG: ABC transporter ATP-binding protein/permease [Clostridiales Family XIII bacterium]|jgi:ATP-binding cassette subfamily B protein|nr:ABC transporter ATP-binding protein/permease [Clostridiales Family XIII bacterium]